MALRATAGRLTAAVTGLQVNTLSQTAAAKPAGRGTGRKSGLQTQVLTLYRQCLRAAKAMPLDSRVPAVQYVRLEFRQKAKTVDRMDFQRIEFLMRQGKKKVDAYAGTEGQVTSFSSSLGRGGGDAVAQEVIQQIGTAEVIAGLRKTARPQ